MIRVLWLAPIPHPLKSNAHPAPWIKSLLVEINNRGCCNIDVLTFSSLCKAKEEIYFIEGVKVTFIKSLHRKLDVLFFFVFRIIKFNRHLSRISKNYDLLHVFGNEHQYEIIFLNEKKLPRVIHIQGILSEIKKHLVPGKWDQFIWAISSIYERIGYKLNTYYSCRTEWDTKVIIKNKNNAQVFRIWEVIRDEFFKFECKAPGKSILFIGGSNKIKGLDVALQAFDIVKNKLNNTKLLIIGNTEISYIEKVIKNNKLKIVLVEDVEVLGFLNAEEIIEAYERSLCLLHPSLIDNSPNSICEAQICGLPVIATNVGGVPSLISDMETGLLINGNKDEIATNIFKLANDIDLWMKLSTQSKSVARNRHNKERIVNDTIQMYKEIRINV